MLNPLFALPFEATRFGLEMQRVMALRLIRLMGGGASVQSATPRIVIEKEAALAEAQTSAATVALKSASAPKIAKTASAVHKKRGPANKRRLSK
jgi:hypothetical protein